MQQLKVCFYVPDKDVLAEIEDWHDSADKLPYTSALMASIYQSGKHRMPSGIWVVFDGADVLRVFFLGARPRIDDALMDRIKARVDEYRIR